MLSVLDQQVQAQTEPGRRTQCDQQIHVACACTKSLPASAVEPRAQPELHRGGQGQLNPAVECPVLTEQHAKHGQYQGEGQTSG